MVKIGPFTLTEEELRQGRVLSDESHRWLAEHREELKQLYPHEWVACIGDRIVDHDKNLKRLARRVWKQFPIEAGSAAVDFLIPGEEPVMIV